MIGEAQVVLIKFPHTDAGKGKLRPALVLKRLPGIYDDWLVCMISTQLRQFEPELDESISPTDGDFEESGLHSENIIRTGRLAVVEASRLIGRIGRISDNRYERVQSKLIKWLS